jgi:large subunit ribosomal protein L17
MFRNQLTALFTHDRIITTLAKAKELRPLAERMVTMARSDTLAARRRVATMVQDKEIARRLFDEIAPRFAERSGGYTRIMRLGRRRGDNAELAIIEFVDYELAEHTGDDDGGGKKGSFLDRAKGVFGGGAAKGEAAAAESEETATVDGEPVETAPAEETEDEPVTTEADDDPVEAEAADDERTEAAGDDEPPADAEPADEPAADEPEADDEEKKDG